MTRFPAVAFLADAANIALVFGQGRREQIAARCRLFPDIVTPETLDDLLPLLTGIEVVFSTWGMPLLSTPQLDKLPNLRAVFYAAGTVAGFAAPLLERGITVTSAWRANGVPVAEWTLAQILLSCKGYWRNVNAYDGSAEAYSAAPRGPGVYGETVALLGAGTIGRTVVELLRPFNLQVIVFDPFLADTDAALLGVEKVTMEEAFARGFVVSNHLADKPETAGLIHAKLMARMRPGATLINTGRGRTVNEPDLCAFLTERPDVTALLDVTFPEPAGTGSPLFALSNAHITTHIAGSINDEVVRMADSAIAEFDRYVRGEPLLHAVTPEMLRTMA